MRDPEREPNLEYEGLEGEGSGEEGELSEELMAEMALATAQQSSAWGRIIRPPRKKGRHVIVDLCAPIAVLPQHRQAELAASRQAAQASPLPKGECFACDCSSHFATLASQSDPRTFMPSTASAGLTPLPMLSLCHVIATTCLVSLNRFTQSDRGIELRCCVLLICRRQAVAVESRQKAADGSLVQEGVLVRQVLASADRKTWLGPAGYALARNSTWGDLWPSFYINRAIISKIGHWTRLIRTMPVHPR